MTATVYTGGATCEVIARPPLLQPAIVNFAANPATVTLGQSVVLSADVTNAVSVLLNGAPVTLPITVTPPDVGPETYTLTATGMAGSTPATATLTVTVNAVVVPPGTLVPLLAPHLHSTQFCWMADYADFPKLAPREVPWTIYADPVNKVLAWPMNGVKPTRIRVWNHFGTPQGLYSMFPAFKDGISEPFEPNVGSDIAAIANSLRAIPTPVGKRGIGYAGPYYSLHDHPFRKPDGTFNPRMPLWLMLRHDGRMDFWMPDGSLQTAGAIPGINYCTEFAIDETPASALPPDVVPPALTTFYVCDFGIPTLTTPSTWRNARIAKVVRGAGKQTATSPEDASKYVVTTFFDMPNGLPVGVRTDEAIPPNIYVADHISGKLTKITPAGAQSVVATIPGVVAMDYDAGKLFCIDNRTQVFVVDIASGAIGPNLTPATLVTGPVLYGSRFWSISVDRAGSFGKIGTFSITRDVGEANLDAYDFVPDATAPGGYKLDGWKGGQGWERVGDFPTVQEIYGHYPWVNKFHRFQGIKATGGVSGTMQLLVAYNAADAAAIPPEIASNKFNFEIGNRGIKWWSKGAPKSSPFNKPSLTCFVTKEGWSPFKDCSFDEMADKPFDVTEAFIRGGMIGQFRRDDSSGADWYAALYWVYRNSQRFLREGQALIDALNAWWLPKYGPVPTLFDPAQHPTTPLDPADRYAVPKADGSGIEMCNMDNLQPSWPVPAGASIIYDQGLPTESAIKPNRQAAATVINRGLDPSGKPILTRAVVVA